MRDSPTFDYDRKALGARPESRLAVLSMDICHAVCIISGYDLRWAGGDVMGTPSPFVES